MAIETIVFDFGGVLIDWNPRHLFKKVFKDEGEMEQFLKEVCTDDWNVEQDRGRTLEEGTLLLVTQYPGQADLIKMYYDRWTEMLNGPIEDSVAILKQLKERYKVYGLTNWSAETFPVALERYDFLQWFDGIVVSGMEKVIKPGREIFDLLVSKYKIVPSQSVFIDDNLKNIEAAKALNFNAVHFRNPEQLRDELIAVGVSL